MRAVNTIQYTPTSWLHSTRSFVACLLPHLNTILSKYHHHATLHSVLSSAFSCEEKTMFEQKYQTLTLYNLCSHNNVFQMSSSIINASLIMDTHEREGTWAEERGRVKQKNNYLTLTASEKAQSHMIVARALLSWLPWTMTTTGSEIIYNQWHCLKYCVLHNVI